MSDIDESTLFKMTEKAFNITPLQKNTLYNNIKSIISNNQDIEGAIMGVIQLYVDDLQERKLSMAEMQTNPSVIITPPKGGVFRRIT